MQSPELRDDSRLSLYLSATLYADGFPSPVKIRNLSSTGAMIEGAFVPSAGELVQLMRGRLIVHALISWHQNGKCGLKFSGSIDVSEWRASLVNSEQRRVDDVVRLVKAGVVPLPVGPMDCRPKQPELAANASLADDLAKSADLISKLGDALAADLDALSRHGTVLQNLDIAIQIIGAVRQMLGEGDPGIDVSNLDSLRRSADQALNG